jgi:hypothetical protein
MYAKWLAILVLAMSPMVATADQTVAKGGRLELRVESREEILESIEREEDRSAILKTFQDRARIDRKAGLRFNVLEFEEGILRELGLSDHEGTRTEIYLKGPYVSGKPGLSFMIKF